MRDLDFRPSQSPTTAKSSQPASPAPSSPKSPSNHSRLWLWLWIVVVLLIVSGLTFLIYQNYQASANQKIIGLNHITTSTNTAVSGSQSTATAVTVYDAGAGASTTDAFMAELQQKGLTAQNLGSSEFQLDQTYIWYQNADQAQAQEITNLLDGKKVSLRPYNGTGPYGVLVQLGP